MANTPEGRVKKDIKSVLAKYGIVAAGSRRELQEEDPDANGWYYMPVKGTAMGVNGIHDFVGVVRGWFFSVEAKAGKGVMTANQSFRARGIRRGGGLFFQVSDTAGMPEFETWLKETTHG